ncbi:LysR family transcriptional regulator [Microbacterium halophytorum]|uniref:LysR family transcriptional regulator n=1 Tax=Microbacterium halophytorum TaxID=2067568 RepID=UPI000CFB293A|nr:LysR family transcriptional regulator [Microbacterium halophytorum]
MKERFNATLHQLRCFDAVASELHFGRAAVQLSLSPSALSDQISALERSLGMTLFIRSPRSVRLSEAGRELVPLARKSLDSADAISQWASRYHAPVSLRVGMVVSSPVFQQAMAEAARVMPHVSWEIKQLGFNDVYDALRRGEVDCAFMAEVGDGPAPDLTALVLWRQPCVLVVNDQHRLAPRSSVRLDELAEEAFIPVGGDVVRSRWFPQVTAPHSPGASRHAQARTFEEVLELCRAGIGVNIAGEDAAEIYPRSGVRYIPLVDAPQAVTYLYTRPGAPEPELGRFVNVVTDVARAHAEGR